MDQAQGRQSGSSFLDGTPGGGAGWASLGAAPASMGWGGCQHSKAQLDGTYFLPTLDLHSFGWGKPSYYPYIASVC